MSSMISHVILRAWARCVPESLHEVVVDQFERSQAWTTHRACGPSA